MDVPAKERYGIQDLVPQRALPWWLVGLLTGGLSVILSLTPLWSMLEWRLYDAMTTSTVRAPAERIIIVRIDEPSFAELGLQWPWPRRLHAELLTSLSDAGARAVGFDILFVDPSAHGPEDDDHLVDAIQDTTAHVVLAADLSQMTTAYVQQFSWIEPLPQLLEAGAVAGLAGVHLERDGVLRRLSASAEHFAGRLWPDGVFPPERALLAYYGPRQHFPAVSYYQALDAAFYLPADFFQDAWVLVGLDLNQSADPLASSGDAFLTPWTLRTGQRTAGVEVQATALSNLLRQDWIQPLPAWLLSAGTLLLSLGMAGWLRHWAPVPAVIALTCGVLAVIALAYGVLYGLRFWLPPAQWVLALVLPWLVQAGQVMLQERRRRRGITHAFSRYVSPLLIERILRDPQCLQLGGEVRQLTVLFLDIRGFTALSERMRDDPQALTQIINRFMTPMSQIVLDEEGTIDKYSGDALMAFWNAPLDVPDHPLRACRAALAMLEALQVFNEVLQITLESADRQPLRLDIGIGINTGMCLVGNLGSEVRFNYSALGDAVNLASRLEGASRLYGYPIIIGPQTAQAVAGRLATLELDLLAVKGKQEAVHVHTLFGNAQIAARPDFMALQQEVQHCLAAYRNGKIDTAGQVLQRIEATGQAPQWVSLYRDRLEALRRQPPPADWRGVTVALSK